jgi:hypothetical protein
MSNPVVDRPVVLTKIRDDFRKRDVAYDAKKNTIGARLDALDARLNVPVPPAKWPAPLPISQQIFAEASWLASYSDDWVRASATLDKLEASLAVADQKLSQQPDGSWGPGFTEWYRKLEPTVDALNLAQETGKIDAPFPLTFMQNLQDGEWLVAYLDSVRTSRIHKTGRNNRDEFGAALTALSQLFFKPKLRQFLNTHDALGFKVSDELATKYKQYLWGIQSPFTGYWGPSYTFWDGTTLEVQDVSYTFHTVHYYDDYDYGDERSVPNLPRIASTTLAIRNYIYPNGWLKSLKTDPKTGKPNPVYVDHNNYDVVALFDDCWPFVDPGVQRRMRGEVQTLIDWCLTQSIDNGEFKRPNDVVPSDAFYYGVRFLQVAGFWDTLTAPWGQMASSTGSPSPKALATLLLTTFKDRGYDDGSISATRVKEILNAVINDLPLPKFQEA